MTLTERLSPRSMSKHIHFWTITFHWFLLLIYLFLPVLLVHDLRVCHALDSISYFQYQVHGVCMVKMLFHGEEHVKKLFSTAVIVNEDTHSNLVRGHCFTGEDTNIFHPWSLKLEGFFRKSTNISFYMVTNLFIYTTGSSHIIDDCSRAVCFCQSLIGL